MNTILFQFPSREKHIILKNTCISEKIHAGFWSNPLPRKIRMTTPTGGHAWSWGPWLTELRQNEQYSMPDGHCHFLWITHRSTSFCKPWISASVPGLNPIFFFQYPFVGTRGMEEAYSKQYTRYSPGKEESTARLAKLRLLSSQISNSFSVNTSWQVRADCALWILSEL